MGVCAGMQELSKALSDPALTADDLSKIVSTGRSFRLPSGTEYEVPAKGKEAAQEAKEAPPALPTIKVGAPPGQALSHVMLSARAQDSADQIAQQHGTACSASGPPCWMMLPGSAVACIP